MERATKELSPHELDAPREDAEAVRIARGEGAVLLALGRTLQRLFRGDLLLQLGYARQADYARERLGIAPRTMFYWLELAAGLRERPFLRRAVLAGLASARKAVEILSVAVGEGERAWTAAAASCSVAELRKAMRTEGCGPQPTDRCYVADTITMTSGQQGRLDAAITAALELIGFGSPRWMCEEAIAQEWLGVFGHYCRERLGRSARAVRDRLFLERRMRALPPLRDALARGRLSFSKAVAIARDATPANVGHRIEDAASTTCQQVERQANERADRRNRTAGVRRVHGPKDAMETVAAAIASCQAWSAAHGEPIERGEAFALLGDYFVSVHEEELSRRRIPRRRREVLTRHGGLCAVPGCTRPAQHVHHIHYRSRGGSNDAANQVAVCAAHHLRGIHHGRLRVTGRGGELLTWELGTGEVFETRGKDDVRTGAGRRAAVPGGLSPAAL